VTAAGAGASTFTLAAPVAAGTAAAPAPPPGPETMNQLVQSMRTQFRNGIGEAVVRLNPDHLGAVSISLRVERGTVTASVAAESPSVRAWLESQEQTLRQNLAGQGLNLDRLVVHPDERDQARQQDEAASKRRQPRNPPDPDAPVFEIIV
jgi:flagellar hook-length control protein FliK